MERTPSTEYPKLSTFYAGKTVALTGGTGFLGQAVITKLLMSCPDINKIIILIRQKKNCSPTQRLEAVSKSPVFNAVRKTNPRFMEKLSCVACDIEHNSLGLSKESMRILRNEVNVFIHSAATLKFNECLRVSFELNVQSTRSVVKLCRSMRNLKAFVHVSTAFANIDRSSMIDEKIYRCNIHYKDFESTLRWMSDESLEKMLDDVLHKRPNTYVLTKAMAEDVITDEQRNLPVCVVRPGMIIASYSDPIPGWIGNKYGPTAFMAVYMKGLWRWYIGDPRIRADLIPVDFVANGVLAAAMKTACDFSSRKRSLGIKGDSGVSTDSSTDDDIMDTSSPSLQGICSTSNALHFTEESVPVYHMVSGPTNPLTLAVLLHGVNHWARVHVASPLLPIAGQYCYSRWFFKAVAFFNHTIPAYFLDAAMVMLGQRRRFVFVNNAMNAGMDVMAYFFTHDGEMKWDRTRTLLASLNKQDQKEFNFDPSVIDWFQYLGVYVNGVRKHILREKDDNYSRSKRQLICLDAVSTCATSVANLCLSTIPASLGFPSAAWNSTSYSQHIRL